MSDLDARTREWYFEAEITMLNMRISELEAENQKIMDRLRYAEIGNPLISSNLKVQSHDELIAITIDKLQTRIKQLEAALKPFAAYYSSDCTNLDPDYCVIADEEENNLTVGLFRAAHKVLVDQDK
jgi:hypothetical protein